MTRGTTPPKIKLLLPGKVVDLIAEGNRHVAAMAANLSWFANPIPTLAAVTAAIVALEQANTAAESGGAAAMKVRAAKERALRTLLQELGAYVQSIANLNPGQEAVIFAAAGWSAKNIGKHMKAALAANNGIPAGTADLVAKAGPKGKKVFYNWRHTLDQGKTFVNDPGTNDADTTIPNLPSGELVGFQMSMTINNVTGTWTDTVNLRIK